MARSRRILAAGALVLLSCPLAACGDDYPERPTAVALEYAKTNDGAKCELLAQTVIEDLTEQRGEAARKACARNVARFPAPQKVTLKEEPGGEEAEEEREREKESEGGGEDRAVVELVADGQEAAIRMRRIDGRWKIVAFAE